MNKLPFSKYRKPRKVKANKRPRLRKIANMKNQAWSLLSQYIRRTHASPYGIVLCFTCDSPHIWKDIQGGHYHHGHYKHTFLVEDNVKPQCVACNKWRNGNLQIYGQRLEKLLGPARMAELENLSKWPFKPTREYYQAYITDYKSRLEALDKKESGE